MKLLLSEQEAQQLANLNHNHIEALTIVVAQETNPENKKMFQDALERAIAIDKKFKVFSPLKKN